MKILVTGAGGHLGRKLFDFLETQASIEVIGLDIRPIDHPNIHEADFVGDPSWMKYFEGIDTIVHLAADREPHATWDSAIRNNMDATLNIYHYASKMGVSRVIFASSNWVHGDKRFSDETLNAQTTPGPINAYGMSKLFGERTGYYFANHTNLSVICLRIGWTQWTHNNKPGTHMAMGRWGQEMWLSDHDFLNGTLATIKAPNITFATLNLISNNPGMRWDIEELAEVTGYRPKDGRAATMTPKLQIQATIKKIFTISIPKFFANTFPEW